MRTLFCEGPRLSGLILRHPAYAALAQQGHEPGVLATPELAALVAQAMPGVRALSLTGGPPFRGSIPGPSLGPETLAAVRRFNPDLVVFAAEQEQPWEDTLREALASVPLVHSPYRRVAGTLPSGCTAEQLNEQLCAAVLGEHVQLAPARLDGSPGQLFEAQTVLQRLGVEPHSYWIACVGYGPEAQARNWPAEYWGEVLAHWAGRFGRKFLLVGVAEEKPACTAVIQAMGARQEAAVSVAGETSLGALVGLVQLAQGYVGKESAALYLASALNRPSLAVIGGEDWPARLPAGEASCVLTLGLPCVGCGGACPFTPAPCVHHVPVSAVLQAVEDLEAGRIRSRETRVLQPGADLVAKLLRDAGETVRGYRRTLATLPPSPVGSEGPTARELELRGELAAAHLEIQEKRARLIDKERLLARLQQSSDSTRHLQERIAHLQAENVHLTDQLNASTSSRWWRLGHGFRCALRRVRRALPV